MSMRCVFLLLGGANLDVCIMPSVLDARLAFVV